MNISILGTGNLGLAIAKGLLAIDRVAQLTLTKRKPETLHDFSTDARVQITSNNLEAASKADVLIIAVQPYHIEGVLQEIKEVLAPDVVLISVATGVQLAYIEAIIGADKNIIRAMPNTAIVVQQSMTCLCANATGKAQVTIAKTIFDTLGASLEIPEQHMQAATVICASGIAFWMRLIRATTQGAIQLGFDADEAQQLAMQTSLGAAQLIIKSGNHPEQEIDKVTTPQGCTIEGLNEMEHQGLSSSLIKGIIASYHKINSIKKLN